MYHAKSFFYGAEDGVLRLLHHSMPKFEQILVIETLCTRRLHLANHLRMAGPHRPDTYVCISSAKYHPQSDYYTPSLEIVSPHRQQAANAFVTCQAASLVCRTYSPLSHAKEENWQSIHPSDV